MNYDQTLKQSFNVRGIPLKLAFVTIVRGVQSQTTLTLINGSISSDNPMCVWLEEHPQAALQFLTKK
jgi:hypothetical protein